MWRIGPHEINGRFVFGALHNFSIGPARIMARRFGAALVYTEMLVADSLVKGTPEYRRKAEFSAEEQPIVGQITTATPRLAREAAGILRDMGHRIVEVNMACPARQLVRSGMGGALLGKPDLAAALVEAAGRDGAIVTVKLRLGLTRRDGPAVNMRFLQRLCDAGAKAFCIHARYVSDRNGGTADWEALAELARVAPAPVIGSGDVRQAQDAVRMLRQTGVDAALIARGAMGRPFVFALAERLLAGERAEPPSADERRKIAAQYLGILDTLDRTGYRVFMAKHTLPAFLSSVPKSRNIIRELEHVKSAGDLAGWAERWGLVQ